VAGQFEQDLQSTLGVDLGHGMGHGMDNDDA
jgi:hypothetical protein